MVRVKQTPRKKSAWFATQANKQRRRASRHPPMKKTTVKRQKGKTCVSLARLARRYPDITKTVCFYPKQASMRSLINYTPRRTNKVHLWYK